LTHLWGSIWEVDATTGTGGFTGQLSEYLVDWLQKSEHAQPRTHIRRQAELIAIARNTAGILGCLFVDRLPLWSYAKIEDATLSCTSIMDPRT
jgi:hypothetical protein